MTFHEKLKKLVAGRNKAQLARSAGLSSQALSDYISKGYIPRADNGVALARALGVDADWLFNDVREWPPSQVEQGLEDVPTGKLLRELARRYRVEMLELFELWEDIRTVDWNVVAASLPKSQQEALEPWIEANLQLIQQWHDRWLTIKLRYHPQALADLLHKELPGANRDLAELQADELNKRLFESADMGALAAIDNWMLSNSYRFKQRPLRLVDTLKMLTEEGRRELL